MGKVLKEGNLPFPFRAAALEEWAKNVTISNVCLPTLARVENSLRLPPLYHYYCAACQKRAKLEEIFPVCVRVVYLYTYL